MSGWSWDEIERGYRLGVRVDASEGEIISAFELVEELLGREWIEAKLPKPNEILTPGYPCARVLSIGRELRRLRHAGGIETILEKIRKDDGSARAELTGAYLCVAREPDADLEFGVPVSVGGRVRVPDFRLRRQGDRMWTWVEVTAPETAEAALAVRESLGTFAPLLKEMPRGPGAEILIRKELAGEETDEIKKAFRWLLGRPMPGRADVDDLALVLCGHVDPAMYVIADRDEPPASRLSAFWVDVTVDSSGTVRDGRLLSARHVFTDDRAEDKLKKKAQQLPVEAPGIAMLSTSQVWGPNPQWFEAVTRRLDRGIHARVSAAVLYDSNIHSTPDGLAPKWISILVKNARARIPAPGWLIARLQK